MSTWNGVLAVNEKSRKMVRIKNRLFYCCPMEDSCGFLEWKQQDPQWRRQASECVCGGGAFEGQTHILGGQDRILKKVTAICPCRYHRTFATQEFPPPLKRGRYS